MGKAGKLGEGTANMLPVLLACSFTASFGQSMMNVALPELAERFGVTLCKSAQPQAFGFNDRSIIHVCLLFLMIFYSCKGEFFFTPS